MDFRLGPAIRDYLNQKNLYGDIDIISMAGGAKDLAQSDESALEGQVDLSRHLHQIKTLILMNHTDCGGYGGHEAFGSLEEERAQLIGDMKNARDKMNTKYPSLEIKIALAHIHEDETIEIEEINE
jgi:hypothetical protein